MTSDLPSLFSLLIQEPWQHDGSQWLRTLKYEGQRAQRVTWPATVLWRGMDSHDQ